MNSPHQLCVHTTAARIAVCVRFTEHGLCAPRPICCLALRATHMEFFVHTIKSVLTYYQNACEHQFILRIGVLIPEACSLCAVIR